MDHTKENGHSMLKRMLFPASFFLALCCNAWAIWTPAWPMGGDALGWVELIDVAARYNNPSTLYSETYTLRLFLEPNSLTLLLAKALGGWLSATDLTRLLLTFYVVGTPVALWFVCTAFRRSPWLALVASPLVFGHMYSIGLLNYLVSVPFLLASVGWARRYGRDGHWLDGLALTLCLVLLYHAHLFGFLVGVSLSTAALLFSFSRWKHTLRLWPLLPMVPVFFAWFRRKFVLREATVDGITFATEQGGFGFVFQTPGQRVDRFYYNSLHLFQDSHWDEVLYGYVLVMLVILYLVGKRQRFLAQEHLVPQTLRKDLHRWIQTHILEILTGCILAAMFVLPSHMNRMALIAERVFLLLFFFLIVSQRAKLQGKLKILLLGVTLASTAYPLYVGARTAAFVDQHVGTLPQFFSSLPPKTKVCVADFVLRNSTFATGTLWYVVRSINAVTTGGLTDRNFANTPYSAVSYRKGKRPPKVTQNILSDGSLYHWDYVVVRSPHQRKEAKHNPALKLVFHQRQWWVYKISPHLRSATKPVMLPTSLGHPVGWDCPQGTILHGFKGSFTGKGLAQFQPVCVHPKKNRQQVMGPTFGTKPSRSNTFKRYCLRHHLPVGLYGSVKNKVQRVGLLCAPLWKRPHHRTFVHKLVPSKRTAVSKPVHHRSIRAKQKTHKQRSSRWWLGPSRLHLSVGFPYGKSFRLMCPPQTVAVGFRGRAGQSLQTIGLACQPLHKALQP